MKERRSVRVIPNPKTPITVAIEDEGLRTAYGVVANISEGGACVLTDGRFEVGRNIGLQLSFAREPQPLDAHGVVVWGGPVRAGTEGMLRYGVMWTEAQPPAIRDRLRTLITRSS